MSLRVVAQERRSRFRGVAEGELPRFELVNRVLGSYWERPGLNLTLAQAARLFGVPSRTCEVVFNDLVRARLLHRSSDGFYILSPR